MIIFIIIAETAKATVRINTLMRITIHKDPFDQYFQSLSQISENRFYKMSIVSNIYLISLLKSLRYSLLYTHFRSDIYIAKLLNISVSSTYDIRLILKTIKNMKDYLSKSFPFVIQQATRNHTHHNTDKIFNIFNTNNIPGFQYIHIFLCVNYVFC